MPRPNCLGSIGIPVTSVGEKLKELNKALEKYGMAVSSDYSARINGFPGRPDTVISAQLEVYFFTKEEKSEEDKENDRG